jgi:hypothetical protein
MYINDNYNDKQLLRKDVVLTSILDYDNERNNSQ